MKMDGAFNINWLTVEHIGLEMPLSDSFGASLKERGITFCSIRSVNYSVVIDFKNHFDVGIFNGLQICCIWKHSLNHQALYHSRTYSDFERRLLCDRRWLLLLRKYNTTRDRCYGEHSH